MSVYKLTDVETEEVKQNNRSLNKEVIINYEGNEEIIYYCPEDKMEDILGERFKIELDKLELYNKENICFVLPFYLIIHNVSMRSTKKIYVLYFQRRIYDI